jgi:hypothetical protein
VIPVLDRATNMQREVISGSTTRLVAARAALGALVDRYAAAVRFGFVDFPGARLGCNVDASCCPSDVLPPSHGIQAFEAALHTCDDPSTCPATTDRATAAALFECGTVFTNQSRDGRYVILLTDGQPGCAFAETSGCALARDQASVLAQRDVRTHVVGIEISSSNIGCLDLVANVGNGNLYLVDSATELNQALEEIMNPIAREACHVDVLSPPTGREQVALLRNGVEIPRSRNDGWDFDGSSATSLTLYGDACDEVIEQGAANLDLRACIPQ